VINALLRWADDDLKARYLPKMATNLIGAYALSEAGSGSDAFALTTRATERDGEWRLTGRKLWITNAHEADVFLVFANANPETPPQCLNVSAFLNRNTDGITLHSYDAAFNQVAYNIFAGYGSEALVAVLQDSSASATSLGAICYSNTYVGNIIFNTGSQFASQMNVGPAPYVGGTRAYYNNVTGWASDVCAGNPICSNSNNIIINPLFVAANALNFSTATGLTPRLSKAAVMSSRPSWP
jgi:hypothetical protein